MFVAEHCAKLKRKGTEAFRQEPRNPGYVETGIVEIEFRWSPSTGLIYWPESYVRPSGVRVLGNVYS